MPQLRGNEPKLGLNTEDTSHEDHFPGRNIFVFAI
jgi:hypothetical protein